MDRPCGTGRLDRAGSGGCGIDDAAGQFISTVLVGPVVWLLSDCRLAVGHPHAARRPAPGPRLLRSACPFRWRVGWVTRLRGRREDSSGLDAIRRARRSRTTWGFGWLEKHTVCGHARCAQLVIPIRVPVRDPRSTVAVAAGERVDGSAGAAVCDCRPPPGRRGRRGVATGRRDARGRASWGARREELAGWVP